jgi:hypothetical protein
MAAEREPEPEPTDQDAERRSGADRRKPRSSFVERIGKARNRRSGKDRRAEDGRADK